MAKYTTREYITGAYALTSVAAAATVLIVVGYWRKAFIFSRLSAYFQTKDALDYNARMDERKRRLFAGLGELKRKRGDGRLVIVEVGSGSGANVKYFPEGTELVCIDPNRHYEAYLRDSCQQQGRIRLAGFHVASCEQMTNVIETGTADAVVCTLVFCHIKNVDRCLHEIRHVLKPGGKLFFLEHVMSPHQYFLVRRIQQLLNVIAKAVGGQGHYYWPTQYSIRRAGFQTVDIDEFEAFELTYPTKLYFSARLIRSHISGSATK